MEPLSTIAITALITKAIDMGVELTPKAIKQYFEKEGHVITDEQAQNFITQYKQTNTQIQGDNVSAKDNAAVVQGDQLNDNSRKIITEKYVENYYSSENRTKKS